jgi:hypothetical protein
MLSNDVDFKKAKYSYGIFLEKTVTEVYLKSISYQRLLLVKVLFYNYARRD